MYRIAVAAFLIFSACKNNDEGEPTDEGTFNYTRFSNRFPESKLPFTIADTSVLNNKDTAGIRGQFTGFVPDTLTKRVFGNSSVTYTPVTRLIKEDAETFYILNVSGGGRKAALLMVFDKDDNYAATFPFLVPDADPATTQSSTIDKSFSIIRGVSRKMNDDVNKEGRDVYAYNPDSKSFTLVMTDILDDRNLEVINPIDTFARTHPLAGDYIRDKRNIVSIRDGSSAAVVNFFIHMEDGDCSGELKGNAVFTSTKTAAYRQGGDPCVLEFNFTGSTVTLKEIEGCGARRGLNCSFDGTFTRKKPTKAPAVKPKKRP